MNEAPINIKPPTPEELRAACLTVSGMPAPNPDLAAKLWYIANLLAGAGPLPSCAILVWRENDQTVRHAVIQDPFVVGRAPGRSGLAIPEDKLLSRKHFSICVTEEGWLLRNLNSKNGSGVNGVEEKIRQRLLRDGDLILAGNHIFAFLEAPYG